MNLRCLRSITPRLCGAARPASSQLSRCEDIAVLVAKQQEIPFHRWVKTEENDPPAPLFWMELCDLSGDDGTGLTKLCGERQLALIGRHIEDHFSDFRHIFALPSQEEPDSLPAMHFLFTLHMWMWSLRVLSCTKPLSEYTNEPQKEEAIPFLSHFEATRICKYLFNKFRLDFEKMAPGALKDLGVDVMLRKKIVQGWSSRVTPLAWALDKVLSQDGSDIELLHAIYRNPIVPSYFERLTFPAAVCLVRYLRLNSAVLQALPTSDVIGGRFDWVIPSHSYVTALS